VIERLDAPAALLDSFVGQTWYQLVASLGMVGVGAGLVLASFWRPEGRLDRRSAALLVALIAPLAMTSVTFMADRDRADQLVYGRYIDAVVWPLAALGAATVVRLLVDRPADGRRPIGRGTLLVTIVVCGLFGLGVAWRHGDLLASDIGLRMMVPGLLPYIGSDDGVPVLTITAIGVAAMAVMIAAIGRGLPRGALAVLAAASVGLLAWSGVRVHDAQAWALNSWDIAGPVARVDELVPAGSTIGVVMVPDDQNPRVPYGVQRQRYQLYQLYLPDREFVWERTPQWPTSDFVFAPVANPAMVEAGATVVWGDPDVRMALWEVPERFADDLTRVPSPG